MQQRSSIDQRITKLTERLYPYLSDCMIHRREMMRKRAEKAKRLNKELECLPDSVQKELLKKYEENVESIQDKD